jgi:hypothetical protein
MIKQANVFSLFARFDQTSKLMSQLRFNLSPRHAELENREGVPKDDHLIDASAEKSLTGLIG